ncbi:hypothetical protein BS78_K016200 [Paspalum vaginatum]|uniref:Uncharacterized protein n=1 Tax=Paspalum vaginatum TaxID=158149 RepID=A0A9W7XF25_9POAL|nr:hypothetical protein BS78_K016200 [Paspalum vaginatum]
MDPPPRHPVTKKQRTIKNVVVNAHRQPTLRQQPDKNVVKYPHAPTARCVPAIFNAAFDHLTFYQRTRVQKMECDGLLLLRAERLGSRELLKFLFDRLDPCNMVINVGKGRGIHVTPFTVKQVLGIPDSGEDLPLRTNNEACKALSDFKALVGLQDSEDAHTSYLLKIMEDDTKYNSRMIADDLAIRIFFIFASNKLLFPSTDNNIRAKDVYLTRDLSRLPGMNWCKAVVDELRDAARTWRFDRMKKVCPSISGCAIFLIWMMAVQPTY